MNKLSLTILTMAALMFALSGCGGGNSSNKLSPSATPGTGRATITILWPKIGVPTRFIHDAADHVRIQVKSGDTLISSQQADRPASSGDGTSTLAFNALPLYNLTFVAEAFSDSQTILSRQELKRTLTPSQPNQIAFTLANQTDHVAVLDNAGAPVLSVSMDLKQNKAKQLQAASLDSSGAILLVSANIRGFTWSYGNPGVVTVDSSTGLITAQTTGTTTITATEKGSPQEEARSATVTVTVSGIDHIDITPVNPVVGVGSTLPLTANPKDTAGNAASGTFLFQWKSADTTVATVDPVSGNVTGVKAGSTQVTVTEPSSGKSASVMVTVFKSVSGTWTGRVSWYGNDGKVDGTGYNFIWVITETNGQLLGSETFGNNGQYHDTLTGTHIGTNIVLKDASGIVLSGTLSGSTMSGSAESNRTGIFTAIMQ
jgi:hypothetical protein